MRFDCGVGGTSGVYDAVVAVIADSDSRMIGSAYS